MKTLKEKLSGLIGCLSRLVRFLIKPAITVTMLVVIFWAVKAPTNLEWWRCVIVGLTLPVLKRSI